MAIGRPIELTPNIATKNISSLATADQTQFTVTGGYRINEIAVYRNGVRLAEGRDFTASDGDTVNLVSAATESDIIEFAVFDSFDIAGTIVSAASTQTLNGDLNVNGKLYSNTIDTDNLNIGIGTITRLTNTNIVATAATVSAAFYVGSAFTANAAGDVETIGIITAASFSGSGANLTSLPVGTTITVADESSDTTCFPSFFTAATGDLAPKTGSNLTFNSSSGALTATSVNGNIVGGTVSGSTGTFSGAVNVDDTTDSTSTTTGALIVDGGAAIAKNVYIGAGLSVAGTLTYEDVTSVDSVGLITAKSGVNITGGQLQVGVAYSVGSAGVATAAGFVGGSISGTTGTFSEKTTVNATLEAAEGLAVTAGVGTFDCDRVRIVRNAGPILELTTNANTADSSIHLLEGSAGSTTNGGAVVYSGAGNRLGICCGTTLTTEKISVLRDSVSVGVGTINPVRHLHLHDQSSDTVQLHITNSTTGVSGSDGVSFALGSDESLIINQRESNKILFKTADTDRVSITSGGDVELSGTAAGVSSVTWDASANTLKFNDNSKAVFGDSSDLSIYHDGSVNHIKGANSRNIYIQGDDVAILNQAGTQTALWYNSGENIELYYANSKRFQTTNEGIEVTGFTSTTAGMGVTGGLFEGSFIKAGKLSDNATLGISTANVFYFTTQETTTATPNIVWNDSYSLSSKMAVGDVASVTVITTAAAGGYSANWTIDGNAVTEEWVGGSAPSAGGSDGLDIYSLTIIKTGTGTGDSGFKLIGNLSNAT